MSNIETSAPGTPVKEAAPAKVMSCLALGETARVVGLTLRGEMRRRLQDLGLIEGAEVRCELRSPLGDPTAYGICGALIALRAADSAGVLVTSIREVDA